MLFADDGAGGTPKRLLSGVVIEACCANVRFVGIWSAIRGVAGDGGTARLTTVGRGTLCCGAVLAAALLTGGKGRGTADVGSADEGSMSLIICMNRSTFSSGPSRSSASNWSRI
jgi:hypothetical protein